MILDQKLPHLLYNVAKQNEERVAFMFKNERQEFLSWTYSDFLHHTGALAQSMVDLGLKREDKIFIFLDNCKEWAIADFAAMCLGIITVPRGTDVGDKDLKLFIEHVDANAIFFSGEKEFSRLIDLGLANNRLLISLEKIPSEVTDPYQVHCVKDLMTLKESSFESQEQFLVDEIHKGKVTDIITITYTSGTSDNPKGVCLTHRTFSFQMMEVMKSIKIKYRKERILTILPIWHAYERIVHYIVLYAASIIMYSKPVAKIFLEDIEKTSPTIIPAVPRVFESVYHGLFSKIKKQNRLSRWLFYFFYKTTDYYYNLFSFKDNRYFSPIKIPIFFKLFLDIFCSIGIFLLYPFHFFGYLLIFRKINKKFGKKLRFLLSGGAHLPIFIDKFFRNMRISLIEGYGMTEMGPLIAARQYPNGKLGSTSFLDGVEYFLQDENGHKNPKKGELFVKSPQMMVGYYKNEKATKEAIINGYLRTGDIVQVDGNAMRIVGRSKNIVVLANGENIETEPFEVALSKNSYIAYSMIVGQDQKSLGALIVPHFNELINYAKDNEIEYKDHPSLCKNEEIREFYRSWIKKNINKNKEFEKTPIQDFVLIPHDFEVNKELTLTLKVKRTYVQKRYAKEIASLYHHK